MNDKDKMRDSSKKAVPLQPNYLVCVKRSLLLQKEQHRLPAI